MNEVDSILVRLLGDGSNYQKMLTEADRSTIKVTQSINTSMRGVEQITGRIGGFTQMLAGYAASLVGIGSMLGAAFKGIQLAAEMEQLQISFGVLTGSAGLAKKTLADLTKFARDTPFQMPEVVNAAKQMLAFGATAEDIVPTMKTLGDISAALNIPLGSMTYLFGTLKAQGRAMTVDINQFAMRGIPIWKELEKQLGRSNPQVRKMVENGEIGFLQIEKAFKAMTAAGGAFGGMMDKQSRSVAGLFSTLKDSVEMSLRAIGDEIIRVTALQEKMKAAIAATDYVGATIQEAPETLKSFISWTLIAIGAIGGLAASWKIGRAVLVWTFGPVVTGIKALWAGLTATTVVTQTLTGAWTTLGGVSTGLGTATLTTVSGGFLAVAAAAAIFVAKMALVAGAVYVVYKAVEEYRGVTGPRDEKEFMAQAARFAKGDAMTKAGLDMAREKESGTGVGAIAEDKKLGISAREAVPSAIKEAMNPTHGRNRNIEMAKEGFDAAQLNFKGLQNTARDAERKLNEVDTFANRISIGWEGIPLLSKMDRSGQSKIEAAKVELEEALQRLDAGRDSSQAWFEAQEKLAYAKAVTDKEIKEQLDGLALEIQDFGMTDQDKVMRKLYGQGNAPEKETEARAKIEQLRLKGVEKEAAEFNKTLLKQAQTFNMTAREVKLYEMAQAGASAETIKITDALMRLNEVAERQKALKEMTRGLQFEGLQQMMTVGDKSRYLKGDFSEGPGDAHLQRLFEMEKLKKEGKATDEELAGFKAEDERKTKIDAYLKALDEGKRITEQFLTPQQKMTIEQEKLDKLFKRGAITTDVYTKAMIEAKESIMGANNAIQKIEAVKFGTNEALDMQQDYAVRMSMQRVATPYGDAIPPPTAADIEGKKPVELLSDMKGHLEVIAGAVPAFQAKNFFTVEGGMGLN